MVGFPTKIVKKYDLNRGELEMYNTVMRNLKNHRKINVVFPKEIDYSKVLSAVDYSFMFKSIQWESSKQTYSGVNITIFTEFI